MSERVNLTAKIAGKLRKARVEADLSQYELADLTGLTRPKIKRIERREITTVSGDDLRVLERELGLARKKTSGSSNGSSNGRGRRKVTAASGRPKVEVEAPSPPLNAVMREEVRRRVEESVLEVMRDLIGESGRVLVEKHGLHDVTLGRLFQAE